MPQPQRQPVIYATCGHYLQGMNPTLKKATHVQLPRCGMCLLWLMDRWSAFTLRHLRSNHKNIRIKRMSSTAVILNVGKWTAYVWASFHLMIYVNVTYTTDLNWKEAHSINNRARTSCCKNGTLTCVNRYFTIFTNGYRTINTNTLNKLQLPACFFTIEVPCRFVSYVLSLQSLLILKKLLICRHWGNKS